jgi:hypothetical protein
MSNVLPPHKGSKAPMRKSNKKRRRRNRSRKTIASQPKAPNQAVRIAQARSDRFKLSECSRLYLQTLTNPFKVTGGVACIPDDKDVPSYKVLIIARGSFYVGTGKFGWVFCDPSAATYNQPAICYTSALFAGTTTSFVDSTHTPTNTVGQFPYPDSGIGSAGILHRTVGCGLRIRYTDTELNRSGRCVPYRSNSVRDASVAGETISAFLSRPEVPSDPVDRQWHCVTYLPTSTFTGNANVDCYSYTDWCSEAAAPVPQGAGFDLGFVVDSSTAGNSFEYEIYWHKEYVSCQVGSQPPGVTKSHSDSIGLSAVRNALEDTLPSTNGDSYYNQALKYISTWSTSDLSGMVKDFVTVKNTLGL